MGKASKALKDFIQNIPNDKLLGFTENSHRLYTDIDFRVDMQGKTSGDPQHYNLQVQINNGTSISTLKNAAGKTVATVLVPIDGALKPEEIRKQLMATRKL